MKRLFSERMGYTEPRTVIQTESMDDHLRTALWNLFYSTFLIPFLKEDFYPRGEEFGRTFILIWTNLFRGKLDEAPKFASICADSLKEVFFGIKWFQVYDFLEFIIKNHSSKQIIENFIKSLNSILEAELSGYRVISQEIVPITAEPEIGAIESALQINVTVSTHINESLKLLSDKESPDFRNSIKESISAVEALARLIAGNSKDELGAALNEIERAGKVSIHGALKKGFSSIYGWTSDAEGIRHSLIDDPSLSQEDAVFMLVACSAFVNYLYQKAVKAGIRFSAS